MKLYFTADFEKKVAKLIRKYPQLKEQFKKQFSLFNRDQSHPGLRLHKLKGKRSEQYAIWILGDLRALAIKNHDEYIFFDLVTHDKY